MDNLADAESLTAIEKEEEEEVREREEEEKRGQAGVSMGVEWE